MKKSFTPLEKKYAIEQPRSPTGPIRKRFFNRTGFTLIELIVVIAIIAVLAAIIAPNAFRAIEKAKVAEVIGDFKALKASMYCLYADTGKWMARETNGKISNAQPGRYGGAEDEAIFIKIDHYFELMTDLGNMPGWDGPYMEKLKAKTPWGGIYVLQSYHCNGASIDYKGWDIWLELEDYCYDNPSDDSCGVKEKIAKIIDRKIDDGDLAKGEFRRCIYPEGQRNWCHCSSTDTLWVIVHNAW
ncbi:MAG: prepilin-type N-terminal cleavage/methylation domain-containing protein [Candidatus Omnitrophica bacterium]|nr:prepilin-type N-terminal cleavage/methylation domain-containing protein [Candidatus Omnitrophota bacterium]MDD5430206.1 prepilin-type N-terminal cleavage/methylation domain-containing protein [Candidatus Omnitrophota bacterium]